MNRERVEGRLMEFEGRMKEVWGRITHDQFLVVAGRRERRLGQIRHRYGVAREFADREIERWRHS